MSNDQNNNPQKEENNPIIPTVSTCEYVDEPNENAPQANKTCNHEQEIKREAIPNGEKKKTAAYWANVISITAIGVNIVMIFITLRLYEQAVTQSGAAKSSAEAAIAAVKESKKANELAEKNGRNSDSTSNESLKLAQASVQAQINSIKEAQKQFNATNQPFLQISDFAINTLVIGGLTEITCTINNLSNIPIKVISQNTVSIIKAIAPPLEEIKRQMTGDTKKVFYYVTKEAPYLSKASLAIPLKKYEYDNLEHGNFYIYLLREIKYKNLVTDELRVYLTYVKMKPVGMSSIYPNGVYLEFLYNENYNPKN